VSGRCCPSIRTVVLPLHAIFIIRSERPDHGVWRPDGWTSSVRLALSRIASGREHTSSGRLHLSSHICIWDRNPIACRTLNGVRTILPRRLDRCTWTLDSSRTLNSGRTILPRRLDRCTWTLDSSRTLNSGRTICHYVWTDVANWSASGCYTECLSRPDGSLGSDFSELESAQNFSWTLK
jgi:hypothetical protein